MTFFMSFVFVLSAVFLSSTANAAQLSGSNGVEFLVINGKKAEKYAKGAHKKIELAPGEYQVIARFEDNLKRGSSTTLFTSKPYVFNIKIQKSDLVLSVPNMKMHSHAAAFFSDPSWTLTHLSTQHKSPISSVELVGSGFGAFSNMEKAVAYHNEQQGIFLYQEKMQDLKEGPVAQDELSQKSEPSAQLKFWYSKANDEEKKAFRRWIIDLDG